MAASFPWLESGRSASFLVGRIPEQQDVAGSFAPMLGMRQMKRIAVMLALVAPLACTALPEPPLHVELRKAEDSAELTSTDNGTVVTVDSESGIGSGRLFRTGEGWPARLSIRLKLGGLESFEMDNGLIHLRTSLHGPKRTPYWNAGKNEAQADADGTLEMTITTTDGVIEIVVPGEMMDPNPEAIGFTWIDFFRR